MSINEKISALRDAMRSHGFDAVIISGSDPHQSEYVADCWQDRRWISGFTGSAGIVVITLDQAGLWTDSRYFLQAEEELSDSEMVMHKQINQFEPEHLLWIKNQLQSGAKVAIDGKDFSRSQVLSMQKNLGEADINLVYHTDPISEIWLDRPSLPDNPIYEHAVMYAGESRADKLLRIRRKMDELGADFILLTALDDIAWTLNLRGSDVECNPVFISYLLIGKDRASLYVDKIKVPANVAKSLAADEVEIKAYTDLISDFNQLPEMYKMMVDPQICNNAVYSAINCKILEAPSPAKYFKAEKNDTEISHIKHVMAKDGAALANAFYWLEQQLDSGKAFSEFEFSEKINQFRSEQPLHIGESFSSIIGYQSNGAVIHYRPDEQKSKTISKEGILLCDSGGQYLDGTTDITRTIALSPPSQEQKSAFTAVLRGMIALGKSIFPEGTTGGQLDILARQFLWQQGLNYGHGTGHGVGFFLNVHEPPQGFTAGYSERSKTVQKPGMLTSNEPGFYKDGQYGIRIENLIVAKKHPKYENFLCFEDVTLYPIDISMIDENAMTASDKAWLNQYHQKCFNAIEPLLSEPVKSWFKWKCRPMN